MSVRATNFRIDSFEQSSTGSLLVRGRLTKTGVFEYKRDGQTIKELRSDKEVFSEDSLASLRGAHVTIDHPRNFVDSDNWHMHSVGTVLDAKADPPYVVGELVVHDSKAQHMIKNGHLSEISCGYFMSAQPCEDSSADFEQIGIRYNHAALGPEGWGRLGGDVSLTLDSNDDQVLISFETKTKEYAMDSENKTEREDQQELPLEDKQTLEKLEALIDSKLAALVLELKKDSKDEEKPLFVEPEYQPTAEDIEQKISERVDHLVDLEVRARHAFAQVHPKALVQSKPCGKSLAAEVIRSTDSSFEASDESFEQLVERAELVARTRMAVKDANDQSVSKLKNALLGIPSNLSVPKSGLRERIANK